MVTITMVPVERRSERVFKAGKEEWPAVERMYRQFAAETGYDISIPVWGDSGDIWLVTKPKTLLPYSLVCGAAEVDHNSGAPVLSWIWIHPFHRGHRRGHHLAGDLWSRIRQEHGAVKLEPPVSRAMDRFLGKAAHQGG